MASVVIFTDIPPGSRENFRLQAQNRVHPAKPDASLKVFDITPTSAQDALEALLRRRRTTVYVLND